MNETIDIKLMNAFEVIVDGRPIPHPFDRSRKGVLLLQHLILSGGRTISRQKLLDMFWEGDTSANPESALKTLVSRLRVQLRQVFGEGGSECIVTEQGGYRWESLPNMTVDVHEIEALLGELANVKGAQTELTAIMPRLLELYTGDLLAQNTESHTEFVVTHAVSLHSRYLEAVYTYVEFLKGNKDFPRVIEVCRTALDRDRFADRLHMELMSALIEMNLISEALVQYKHVMHLYERYLGVKPGEEMQAFYRRIVRARQSVEFSLEAITAELLGDGGQDGAFVCEYTVFKEVFHLQMRSLERSGVPVFLAVVMVDGADGALITPIEQDGIMNELCVILRDNLRRGDTITRFSPTMFALLLPTVNYATGNAVMERMKRLFYRKYPSSNIAYNYLIGPLNGELAGQMDKDGGAETGD